MDVREKRLIDANALIAEYDRVHIGEPGKARKLMKDAHTVDAVEVVRCRECKWWHEDDDIGHCDNPDGLDNYAKPDDFCSYGERKEGAD